ncbi:unnamed protein product [Kuraishia capsulata CBS 1993]|uniref:Uncharacterized protein n=1 Tax=Kuraishia capsulata CBS 1993 TaxID=1382522 RepID=W6MNR9_9ASCO|nr:uncharacterized protein KUCA_T00003903001 [Kuraishia capsulata CBS 1993]CDK27923.1 unnamed protein product [Kuraishia capsulata CBS 1993]
MSDEFPLTFICGPETNFTVYEVGYENLMNSWYCGQNFGSQESDNKNSKSVQRTSNDSDKFPAVLDCGSGDFAIFRNGSLVEDYSYAYECGKELQEALHSAAPAMLRRQGKTTLVAYIFAILILSGFAS